MPFRLVLAGNKCDLGDEYRQVSFEMGQQLANEWNCQFVETSAKERINIDRSFEILVRELREMRTLLLDESNEQPQQNECHCKIL